MLAWRGCRWVWRVVMSPLALPLLRRLRGDAVRRWGVSWL